MPPWRPQLYGKQARDAGANLEAVANAIATGEMTIVRRKKIFNDAYFSVVVVGPVVRILVLALS
jgi:hypothetical protein